MQKEIRIKNRKAHFEYFVEQEFTAGIMLTGAEVKSVREGKASISEAYCYLSATGIMVKGMHIAEFKNAGYLAQEPHRERQLLLNKTELKKLNTKLKDQGYTIIPLELFFAESGYAKLLIGLCRGKKNFDKREDLKSKDLKRELERFG
ncbi:MAG: SsrA-binding protein SmpB [Flavobacteriales bacterium]|nr:SsrA-binding protein SmpB [Flavobacteriales bacterium]